MYLRKSVRIIMLAMLLALPACSEDSKEDITPIVPVEKQVPQVITIEAQNVTESSVELSGEVIADNGYRVIERGFVYSTSENPDIENAIKFESGRGLGVYSATVRDLQSNTHITSRHTPQTHKAPLTARN